MYTSTPPSPEVENFLMKICYPAGDRTPDLLNQKQTCYHLSQRGELLRNAHEPDFQLMTDISVIGLSPKLGRTSSCSSLLPPQITIICHSLDLQRKHAVTSHLYMTLDRIVRMARDNLQTDRRRSPRSLKKRRKDF